MLVGNRSRAMEILMTPRGLWVKASSALNTTQKPPAYAGKGVSDNSDWRCPDQRSTQTDSCFQVETVYDQRTRWRLE